MNTTNGDKENIVSFQEKLKNLNKVKQTRFEEDAVHMNEEYLEAVNVLKDTLDSSIGFYTIVFDELNNPVCLGGGDIDFIKLLGVMRFTEHELLHNNQENFE